MTRSRNLPSLRLAIVLIVAVTCLTQWNCKKKDNPVDNPAIDPHLVGVWYNQSDTVGFEILSDGTMNSLDVDSAGFLRYAVIDTVNGALILNVESARSGAISIQGRYKSRTIDSAYVATGTYSFSNNYSTLTLILLLPLNGATQTTFVYLRSSVGVKVISYHADGRSDTKRGICSCRGDRIRTYDFLLPKQAL